MFKEHSRSRLLHFFLVKGHMGAGATSHRAQGSTHHMHIYGCWITLTAPTTVLFVFCRRPHPLLYSCPPCVHGSGASGCTCHMMHTGEELLWSKVTREVGREMQLIFVSSLLLKIAAPITPPLCPACVTPLPYNLPLLPSLPPHTHSSALSPKCRHEVILSLWEKQHLLFFPPFLLPLF